MKTIAAVLTGVFLVVCSGTCPGEAARAGRGDGPGATSGRVASGAGGGRLVAMAPMLARRFDHSATLLPDGRVLIAGGMEQNGVYLDSLELYDPVARRWAAAGRMPSPRACHAAVLLADGRVLLAGGSDGRRPLASAALYDPATGRLLPTGSLTTPRCGAATVELADRRVLLVGGEGPGPEPSRLASAEIYDPSTGKFAATGGMRIPRVAHAAVRLGDGRVLVVGGASAGRFPEETVEASAELYDPATGRFAPTGNMSVPRYKLGVAALADGRALVVGGSDRRAWRGEYASAELYDPTSGRFTRAAELAHARYKLPLALVRLSNGEVLVAGGAARAEIYEPRRAAFHDVEGASLDGFCFSTATLLRSGAVLIAGGYGDDPGRGGTANAWVYEP